MNTIKFTSPFEIPSICFVSQFANPYFNTLVTDFENSFSEQGVWKAQVKYYNSTYLTNHARLFYNEKRKSLLSKETLSFFEVHEFLEILYNYLLHFDIENNKLLLNQISLSFNKICNDLKSSKVKISFSPKLHSNFFVKYFYRIVKNPLRQPGFKSINPEESIFFDSGLYHSLTIKKKFLFFTVEKKISPLFLFSDVEIN